jgi:hypothetical protein
MNWVGGARSRVRHHNERKIQKDFFERKRILGNGGPVKRFNTSPMAVKYQRVVSQDLLSLKALKNTCDEPAWNKVPTVADNHHKVIDLDRSSNLNLELSTSPLSHPPSMLELHDIMNTHSSPSLYESADYTKTDNICSVNTENDASILTESIFSSSSSSRKRKATNRPFSTCDTERPIREDMYVTNRKRHKPHQSSMHMYNHENKEKMNSKVIYNWEDNNWYGGKQKLKKSNIQPAEPTTNNLIQTSCTTNENSLLHFHKNQHLKDSNTLMTDKCQLRHSLSEEDPVGLSAIQDNRVINISPYLECSETLASSNEAENATCNTSSNEIQLSSFELMLKSFETKASSTKPPPVTGKVCENQQIGQDDKWMKFINGSCRPTQIDDIECMVPPNDKPSFKSNKSKYYSCSTPLSKNVSPAELWISSKDKVTNKNDGNNGEINDELILNCDSPLISQNYDNSIEIRVTCPQTNAATINISNNVISSSFQSSDIVDSEAQTNLIDIIDSEAQTNTIDIVDSEAQTNLIDIVDSEAQTNLIDSEAQTNLIDIIDSEAQTDSTDTGIVILTEELNSTVTDVLQELSDYYDIISTSSELSVISDKVHKLMNLLEKLKNQHNM